MRAQPGAHSESRASMLDTPSKQNRSDHCELDAAADHHNAGIASFLVCFVAEGSSVLQPYRESMTTLSPNVRCCVTLSGQMVKRSIAKPSGRCNRLGDTRPIGGKAASGSVCCPAVPRLRTRGLSPTKLTSFCGEVKRRISPIVATRPAATMVLTLVMVSRRLTDGSSIHPAYPSRTWSSGRKRSL